MLSSRSSLISELYTMQAEDEYEKIYLTGLLVPEEGVEEYPPALTEPDPMADVFLDWSRRGLVSSVKSQVSHS